MNQLSVKVHTAKRMLSKTCNECGLYVRAGEKYTRHTSSIFYGSWVKHIDCKSPRSEL